jgi:hypothetical protein
MKANVNSENVICSPVRGIARKKGWLEIAKQWWNDDGRLTPNKIGNRNPLHYYSVQHESHAKSYETDTETLH